MAGDNLIREIKTEIVTRYLNLTSKSFPIEITLHAILMSVVYYFSQIILIYVIKKDSSRARTSTQDTRITFWRPTAERLAYKNFLTEEILSLCNFLALWSSSFPPSPFFFVWTRKTFVIPRPLPYCASPFYGMNDKKYAVLCHCVIEAARENHACL